MAVEFAHLHVHTQFSFLSSTVKIENLAERTAALGMRAVAVTDHANMFGAIRHYKQCKQRGVQQILGSELNVVRDGTSDVSHLVLLAASSEGYRNLIRLVSQSYTDPATSNAPSVTLERIAGLSKGLVALSGCLGGVAPQRVLEYGPDAGEPMLARLRDSFEPGHLFVELQDHGLPEQAVVNDILSKAARRLDLPLVATNDVHFVSREDGQAQVYLECIRQNRSYAEEQARHHGSFEMFLKSPAEMADIFCDVPEAIKGGRG